MASIKKRINDIAIKTELETELLPGQLLVEIFGFERVIVEHHNGVIKYEPCEICIKSKKGLLHIYGMAMCLAVMTRERLVVTGVIDCVKMEKGK